MRRVVLALLGLALLGAGYESLAESLDARRFPPPGRMIDVGTHRLHLHCRGTGTPTVVIEAGLGDWSTSWTQVQAQAARTTRVCTYDRAGMGFSEAGPLPRTAQVFARELHTLLRRGKVPRPYVLVGHSLGGLPVRLYAKQDPGDVAGVVLIESMYPEPRQGGAAPPVTRAFSPLALVARFGMVRALAGPLAFADGLPADVAGAYVARLVTPRNFQTTEDEGGALPASLAQAAAVTTLGDLPLIVLSRGRDANPTWHARQAALRRLSTRSEARLASRSGHMVQLDEPGAAVTAITGLVRQVREAHRPPLE